jgi:thiol-disulfide isomerase/thioredoxin
MRPRLHFLFSLFMTLAALSYAGGDAEAPPSGVKFETISLDEAIAKAGEQDRVVLIDFYTTWCPPCKLLDLKTWPDADVATWADQHAICLKLDAEKEVALATTHEIDAYPTILFLSNAGEEMGRIVGFRDPKMFLLEAEAILAGKPLSGEQAMMAQGYAAGDPMVRQQKADELARAGKHVEALEEYLWCYDHGLDASPSYVGVRSSFLLGAITSLGAAHPPAMEALRTRRDALVPTLSAGTEDYMRYADFASLNQALGESEKTLELYDSLPPSSGKGRLSPRQLMFREVTPLLMEARRYADVLQGAGSLKAWFAQEMEMVEYTRGANAEHGFDGPEYGMESFVVEEGADYLEALLGVGETDEATTLKEQLLTLDGSGETYALFVRRAIRAGDLVYARALVAEAKERVPADDDYAVKLAEREIPTE